MPRTNSAPTGPSAADLRSAGRLRDYFRNNGLVYVDSREWHDDWKERWVVFADLIAFAARSVRSPDVVLNNIVRFDRASQLAREVVKQVKVFRFSDSTFGVADEFSQALSFAVAIHHTCLAMNAEYMDRVANPLFVHMIVPRVTLAYGFVLDASGDTLGQKRFDGIDPKTLIAGGGIVKAHHLEKVSAGGLLTTNADGTEGFRKMILRGGPSSTQRYISSWQKKGSRSSSSATVLFLRGGYLDVPWLLLQPVQQDATNLRCAEWSDATEAITAFLRVWELGAREFYSPAGADNPLDTSKHFSAAIRHGINCSQARVGQFTARYYQLEAAREMLKTGKAPCSNRLA